MARRPRAEQVETEVILDAAAKVFAAQGFAGARVDAIARRAGVNKAMLYYRVGDKAALYTAVLGRFFEPLAQEVAGLNATDLSPEAALRRLVAALVHHLETKPDCKSILLREIAGGGADLPTEILQVMARVLKSLQAILERGVRDGAFRAVNPLLAHFAIIGTASFYLAARPARERARAAGALNHGLAELEGSESLIDALVGLLLQGVRAQGNDHV